MVTLQVFFLTEVITLELFIANYLGVVDEVPPTSARRMSHIVSEASIVIDLIVPFEDALVKCNAETGKQLAE